MVSRCPKVALRCAAVSLTVAVVIPVASGIGAVSETRSIDTKLVGTWTRTLTKVDIKRAHVVPGEVEHAYPGLVVVLIVKKNGAAEVKLKGQSGPIRWQGRLVPLGAHRLHIAGMPLDVPNVYRWRVSGRLLTFAKISDRDITGLRDAWFTGVWKRK